MIQVYVTEMPEVKEECPFYNCEEDRCNMHGCDCCLDEKNKCEHLLNLSIM